MFGKQIKIFEIFGVEVRIDTSWIFIALLVTWSLAAGFFPAQYPDLAPETYWTMGIMGAFFLFFSIIFHEFSHSLVARKYGIPITSITLFIFGGVAQMEKEPGTPRAELLMAIAGPIASLFLGGIFWGLAFLLESLGASVILFGVCYYLGLINIILAVFNMVPAFPLDGGRVFRSILWEKYQDLEKATKKASKYGSGFGTGFMLVGVFFIFTGNFIGGVWWIFIGLFLKNAAFSSLQQVLLKKSFAGKPVADFMAGNPITVSPEMTIQELVENYIYKHHHKLYPVKEGVTLIGLVEFKDIKGIDSKNWQNTVVGSVMQPLNKNNSIPPTLDAMEALARMQKNKRSRVLVVSKERDLLGILTLKDMLDYFTMKKELEKV